MSADDFFSRWSRRRAQEPAPPETVAAPAPDLPPPTLEEVAALGHDADFSRFVKPGVDEAVRRSAMKKLFTDPHFNVMDGLDIYIDDYTKFEPIPAAMLAMLEHAKPVLDPLGHLKQPAMAMLDQVQLPAGAQPANDAQPDHAQQDPVPETGEQAGGPGQANEGPAMNQAGKPSDTQADNAAEPPANIAAPDDDHTI